jgi:hypothetical protein
MNVPLFNLVRLCYFLEERYERIKGENITAEQKENESDTVSAKWRYDGYSSPCE